MNSCLMCGTDFDPTVEYIIPHALWRCFRLNPDALELGRYRTQLCAAHNCATSKLHNNQPLIDLRETGEIPTDKPYKPLAHVSTWAVWVTLLMGLRTGQGVFDPTYSRKLLRKRFDARSKSSNLPAGTRVYAARVDDYVWGTDFTSHQVAVKQDGNVVLDCPGNPSGIRMKSGPITATEAIGIGKVFLLVLSPTYSSGPGHEERVDKAAAVVGLERIYPPPTPGPSLEPKRIDMRAVSELFLPPGHGDNLSLLPSALRSLMAALDSGTKSM